MQQLRKNRAQLRIRPALGGAAVALLCAASLWQPAPACAAPHGGGGGGGFHGGGGGLHGGRGFHGGGFASGWHGSFAGMHNGFGGGHEDQGWHNGRYGGWWDGGLGRAYDPYSYGWDYDPGYSYYGSSQPYASQTWYYCSDPAGYYPHVTQCNTGWQTVPGG